LSDAKKCGDEFLGRVFVGSHSARRGRGGMPLSRTEHAEVAEACHYLAQSTQRHSSLSTLLHTSDFMLPTSFSRFLLRPTESRSVYFW